MAEIEMLPTWAGRISRPEEGQAPASGAKVLAESPPDDDWPDDDLPVDEPRPQRRSRSKARVVLLLLLLIVASVGSGVLAAYLVTAV